MLNMADAVPLEKPCISSTSSSPSVSSHNVTDASATYSTGNSSEPSYATPTDATPPVSPDNAKAIAICGMALRLPGDIRDADTFWDVLHNGRDTRSEIPTTRFHAGGFDRTMGAHGFDIRHGYFLDQDLACLDSFFFSCRSMELERMDPQCRQLLEVVRECLENAGETEYRGSQTGCYVGTFGDDWQLLNFKDDLKSGGGSKLNLDLFLANRVSYEFNLRGPR